MTSLIDVETLLIKTKEAFAGINCVSRKPGYAGNGLPVNICCHSEYDSDEHPDFICSIRRCPRIKVAF